MPDSELMLPPPPPYEQHFGLPYCCYIAYMVHHCSSPFIITYLTLVHSIIFRHVVIGVQVFHDQALGSFLTKLFKFRNMNHIVGR